MESDGVYETLLYCMVVYCSWREQLEVFQHEGDCIGILELTVTKETIAIIQNKAVAF